MRLNEGETRERGCARKATQLIGGEGGGGERRGRLTAKRAGEACGQGKETFLNDLAFEKGRSSGEAGARRERERWEDDARRMQGAMAVGVREGEGGEGGEEGSCVGVFDRDGAVGVKDSWLRSSEGWEEEGERGARAGNEASVGRLALSRGATGEEG